MILNVRNLPESQQDRGFLSTPYPCIRLSRFTILTLRTHPLYNTILERLKSPNSTYLDVGCCFGQDLRQLVLDGVPSQNLTGLDIEGALMEYGYELFLDRQKLQSSFVVADIFKGASQGKVWMDLQQGGIDVLHCSAFFHLFSLEDQIVAAKQIAKLVKKGGVILADRLAVSNPEMSLRSSKAASAIDTMWRHSVPYGKKLVRLHTRGGRLRVVWIWLGLSLTALSRMKTVVVYFSLLLE